MFNEIALSMELYNFYIRASFTFASTVAISALRAEATLCQIWLTVIGGGLKKN